MTPKPLLFTAVAAAVLSSFACGGGAMPVVCREGQAGAGFRATPSPAAGQHVHGHAHNDYEHTHPLQDALDNRLYSVEADVWYDGGRFKVGHNFWDNKGTLKELYLDPLQALVTAKGSIHGDGVPFTLWIDFKDANDKLPADLEALLAQYPMLSRFTPTFDEQRPVTVALTGDARMKAAVVDLPERHALRDSNNFSVSDPPADSKWRYYALSWGSYLDWNGQGDLPADQRQRLGCIMENARANGRKVRLYSTPDRAEAWKAQLELGVDFINTDHLPELNAFLDAQP